MTATLPLAGVRVLEFCSGTAAAFCGHELAMWGADVAVVDRGDRSDRPSESLSAFLGANKRLVTLNPGQGLTDALARADVLITDLPAISWHEVFGTVPHRAEKRWPQLVIVSFTPFGLSGPDADLPATDLIVDAASGFMSLNGAAGRAPLRAPGNVLPFTCGANGFVAVLAALRERRTSGRGRLIELSLVEAAASLVPFLRTEYSGVPQARAGGPSGALLLRCRDGYICVNAGAERSWPGVLLALGVDPAELPPVLATVEGRRGPQFRAFLEERLRDRGREELFETLSELRVVAGVFRTSLELLDNPQLRARRTLLPFTDGSGRAVVPWRPATFFPPMEATPPVSCRAPAALDWHEREAVPRPRAGRRPRWPLAGLRVLDLTHAWIGPHATLLLAELGAEVVKVESIEHPDVWRVVPGPAPAPQQRAHGRAPHPWNTTPLFNATNAGKRSLVLELDRPDGRALFLRLVAQFDVVIENFTPRVLANLGIGFEELVRANPAVVLVSYSGFGTTGPWRDFRANGATTEANAGWDSLFGYAGEGPLMLGAMQADAICGVEMAATTLLALRERERTGRAVRVDGSMFETAVHYIGDEIVRASRERTEPMRMENAHPTMVPHGVYRCAGDDRWLALAIRDDEDWARLCEVAASEHALHDPRFRSADGRRRCRAQLEALIVAWCAKHDGVELQAALRGARIPASLVLRTDEVLEDPHFRERAWFRSLHHPDRGVHRYNGPPWRLAASRRLMPPPRLGQHSRAILRSELGIAGDEFARLRRAHVTGSLLSLRQTAI